MGNTSSLIAYRRWNRLICSAILFSRLAITRKKVFRSLEAYNQIWIITAKDGTINYAHCLGCKAGLAESCSLIASVLFYLEVWTKVNGRLSCTQIKCPLILPSSANKVEYSRVRDINFKSAKKNESRLWWNDRESQWGTLGFWELGSLFWKPCSKTGGASADASGNGKLLFWPQQMQNKACTAELGAHCWFDIERNVLVNQLFVFWTRFLPRTAFHVLLQHVSAHDLSLGGNFKIGLKLFDRTTFRMTKILGRNQI